MADQSGRCLFIQQIWQHLSNIDLEEFLLVHGLKKYVWSYLVLTEGTYHKDYF